MTRQLIEITFGNALTQASHLEDYAHEMRQLAQGDLSDIKNELHMAWQGDSSDAYVSKVDMTAENIICTANKLEQAAATIRRIAYIFRESELKAIELAETRGY